MKTPVGILLIVAAFSLAIFGGCNSDASSPVTSSPNSDAPDFVKLPERLDKALSKQVSVTQFITAAQGGTLRLLTSYKAAPDSHLVTIDVKLVLRAGDLPYDASLTLTLDDVLFLTNVDLTFGPHGITFNRQVDLSATATGLTTDASYRQLKLYYIDNGTWVKMNGSNGSLVGGDLDAKGKLPHFSQYAFGRVED
ncbi:MAG: hypothetical protein ABI623_04515 [bacterium]